MKIHNVRLGFANNSSSSHSLIFLPERKGRSKMVQGADFGWDYFTAASKEDRTNYVALTLFQALNSLAGLDMAYHVTRQLVPGHTLVDAGENSITKRIGGYIDHQSLYCLPTSWDGKFVHEEFFQEFCDYLLQDGLVILGGNDNSEEAHPLVDGKNFRLPIPRDQRSQDWVARKDPAGFWVLFNRKNGGRVMFTMQKDGEVTKADKTATPMLVDIKITDWCPFGCEFCYQDSTLKGVHADKGLLSSLAYALEELQVFEVALGGGEPTMHPDFVSILSMFRRKNIVPNFTTKSLVWLRDDKQRRAILPLMGSLAYSVAKRGEVKELATILKYHNVEVCDSHSGQPRIAVQVVIGVVEPYDLSTILREAYDAGLQVTLLGYKNVGRGPEFKPKPCNWLEQVKYAREDYKCPTLAIDTVLIEETGKAKLEAAKVPEWMYHTREGQYSMYIDAVAKQMAPSSYAAVNQYLPLMTPHPKTGVPYLNTDEIQKAYAKF